jgi:hypothetical protein
MFSIFKKKEVDNRTISEKYIDALKAAVEPLEDISIEESNHFAMRLVADGRGFQIYTKDLQGYMLPIETIFNIKRQQERIPGDALIIVVFGEVSPLFYQMENKGIFFTSSTNPYDVVNIIRAQTQLVW